MYTSIMIPVDLEHADKLEKALTIGVDIAKLYDADIHVVGVTHAAPGVVAHNPKEYAEKLDAFAAEQKVRYGVDFAAKAMVSHDPAIDLDDTLKQAASEIGADLIVMASHVPNFLDHIVSSNAGYLASHTSLSVFVVR